MFILEIRYFNYRNTLGLSGTQITFRVLVYIFTGLGVLIELQQFTWVRIKVQRIKVQRIKVQRIKVQRIKVQGIKVQRIKVQGIKVQRNKSTKDKSTKAYV